MTEDGFCAARPSRGSGAPAMAIPEIASLSERRLDAVLFRRNSAGVQAPIGLLDRRRNDCRAGLQQSPVGRHVSENRYFRADRKLRLAILIPDMDDAAAPGT